MVSGLAGHLHFAKVPPTRREQPFLRKRAPTIMNVNRLWLEVLGFSSAVACALALLLATFGAATAASESGPSTEGSTDQARAAETSATNASAASSATAQETYEGMVTDSHCGARHEAAIDKTASDCTRTCVHAGAHFALVNGDKIYVLTGDLEMLKHSAGRRSKVTGALSGDTIAVASIAAAF